LVYQSSRQIGKSVGKSVNQLVTGHSIGR